MERRLDPDTTMASEPTLSTLAQLAAEADAQNQFHVLEDNEDEAGPSRTRTKEQLRRYYLKALHKVIDQSDIVVLVLDARDPEGCRSRLVEEEVRRREAEGKKLVFVLNKIGAYSLSTLLVACQHSYCRSHSQSQCSGMAQVPPTLNTYSTLPLQRFDTPAK